MTQIRRLDRLQIEPSSEAKSRYLPPDLADRFRELAQDPDLLSMADGIALLDLRETQMYERLNTPAPDYEVLADALSMVRISFDSSAPGDFDLACDRMSQLLRDGIAEERTWATLERILALRKTLVETERRRAIQERTLISLDQARSLVTRLVSVVDLCVEDKSLKARIMAEFRRAIQVDGSVMGL